MSLGTISSELYRTAISTEIRTIPWIIPTVQSIHIVSVSIVVGAALVSDLRLAGALATDETPRTVVRRYLPWMWTGLVILLATGMILTVGEPNRVLTNWVFWTKMTLVLIAFALTLLFRYPILHPEFRLENARWAKLVKPMAWTSLAIWVAVIFCGRWIAYVI
jgi:hypothetical protein